MGLSTTKILVKIRVDEETQYKVSTGGKDEGYPIKLKDIRAYCNPNAIGLAIKDSDGCWKVARIGDDDTILPHEGGWEDGVYSCWPVNTPVANKKIKIEDSIKMKRR